MQSEAAASVIERQVESLDRMLDALEAAKPFAKASYQTDVFQVAETLMASDAGMRALYSRAHRFDEVGVFHGGPWVDASKLQPPLVAGSLQASGVYPVVETLSELRVLAIAKGAAKSDVFTQAEALGFLNDVLALNLQYVFPGDTEQERIEGGPHRDSALRLFALIADEVELRSLRGDVLEEIGQICAQRPIMTSPVRRMIAMVARIPDEAEETAPETMRRLDRFTRAVEGPSPLSRDFRLLPDYRRVLMECEEAQLIKEAEAFGESMSETGLVAQQHAVLLRRLRAAAPDAIAVALAVNDVGKAELEKNRDLVHQLIGVAILPSTAQSIYGLARLLERGLLSRTEVTAGLQRLVSLDLQSDVRRKLLSRREKQDGVTANSLLLAGTLSVLGQPLGVGQGRNPTCQAARGISLWAQHAPGYLLELLISAARDGEVSMPFDAEHVSTRALPMHRAAQFDLDLDPVSIVLVPHLDRLYEEMMKRIALRKEDGHKWVNPALYGRWVPRGFASVFADVAQTTVADHADFVRRFYATHHPAYNDGHRLMYPNPVGLCITNSHGDYLGPHAVSLQRVDEGPDGNLRAFFYNPNNEGRQDWGGGVKPSIWGQGEREGESSLLFRDFVKRLYAFHYNPFEEGDAYAVPDEEVEEISAAARSTWGRAFVWQVSSSLPHPV